MDEKAMAAAAEMPGVEEIARALIAHFVEHTGFTTVDEDETKTCVSAYYGGVWVYLRVYPIARAILDLFAPILAEKERRDAIDREQAETARFLQRHLDNPQPPSDALKKLFADYKAAGIESVGFDSPFNACCYSDNCKALESRALAAEALVAEKEREIAAWRRNSSETWQAMVAMRNSINEHLPMPSLEGDLRDGPSNGVFCEAVARAVVGKVTQLEAECREMAMQALADDQQLTEALDRALAAEAALAAERAMLKRIVDLHADWRLCMPKDWEGDPLSDACEDAASAIRAQGE